MKKRDLYLCLSLLSFTHCIFIELPPTERNETQLRNMSTVISPVYWLVIKGYKANCTKPLLYGPSIKDVIPSEG